MKTFLIIIGFIGLVVAASFYPVNHKATRDDGDLPFNVYCPVFVEYIPTRQMVDLLDGQIFHKYMPNRITACALKEAIDRAEENPNFDTSQLSLQPATDYKNTIGDIVGLFVVRYLPVIANNHPSLRVYFLDKIFKISPAIGRMRADLGVHYSFGRGVSQDKEKATHLYRQDLLAFFNYSKKPEQCVAEEEKEFQSEQKAKQEHFANNATVLEYVLDPLYTEQVRWVQSLCHKTPDEIYEILEWYMHEDNTYRSPHLVLHVTQKLAYVTKEERFKRLNIAAFKEKWPHVEVWENLILND